MSEPITIDVTDWPNFQELQRRYIKLVLTQKTFGKKDQAAGIIGIDRKTLYRKLKSMEQATSKETQLNE